MNRIEQRLDGSRWMQVIVAGRSEWRELETKTETYKYFESPAEHTIIYEQPKLNDGECLFWMSDGRVVIVYCWQGQTMETEDLTRWDAPNTPATTESMAPRPAKA